MPNAPRPDNPHRAIRVEDDLWEASRVAAEAEGTTRAEVMRQGLQEIVERQNEGLARMRRLRQRLLADRGGDLGHADPPGDRGGAYVADHDGQAYASL